MSATNFILDVYSKLFALLEAHTPIASALKVGNEVREDQNKRYPRTLGAKQPADFPRAYLTVGDTSGTIAESTFSYEDVGFDPTQGGWEEQIIQSYELKIVHEACDLAKNSLFEAEALTALRKGGPRLSKSYVIGWTYTARRQETAKGEASGVKRQITTIIIPVTMQFDGAQLIT